ncbi:uncharacterized protein LOC121407020 [Lytechinus variegatus]|uniref:uncharacterized protein LOC121407020 n=1 Tax=Lytechinus variegatus TaxID=7654 RepID=UPI001BB14B87|nr:uncharacterized protein LOC121407020 [Lytechinus variegatus]
MVLLISCSAIHLCRSSSHSIPAASDSDMFDISVSYYEKGDFVYPKEDVLDEESDSDYEDPELTLRLQIGEDCKGLTEVGEEEHEMGEEIELEETPQEAQFTRSGLHQKSTAQEAEDAKLFVISENRLLDTASKAISKCTQCASNQRPSYVISSSH